MGVLALGMWGLIAEQQLGFVATVCPDGTPNLSPKGTLAVWDDDHLLFADISSPSTIANLRGNRALEINVVDMLTRKGYRFKGTAVVLHEGAQFDAMIEFYRNRGATSTKQHMVLMKVELAAPVISPAYAGGADETKVTAHWRLYADWYKSLFGAPPPANPARNTNPC